MMSDPSTKDVAPEKGEAGKGNPLLNMLDNVLRSGRKFLEQQKLLKVADELAYLSARKSVEFLQNTFIPMKVEGAENVPDFKPAILCSIVEQPVELGLATVLTPRRIHFMVPAKLFETPGLKPVLEAIGAYRSTTSQEDMEPVQKTIEFLTQHKDLVAMVPIDTGEQVRLEKSISGVLKFAAGVPCPVVPYASSSLKRYKLGKEIRLKVAPAVEVKRNIKREDRHALAVTLIEQIMAMKAELDAREA